MKRLMVVLLIALSLASCSKEHSVATIPERKVIEQEAKIEKLTGEHNIVAFEINERSATGFSFRILFVAANGNDVIRDYYLEGKELHLDFYQVPLAKQKDAYIHFPYKLYSDEISAQNGISLFDDVELFDNGIPISYPQNNFFGEDIQSIEKTRSELRDGRPLSNSHVFGRSVHDLVDVSSYKTGVTYRVIARTSGGIEVLEE